MSIASEIAKLNTNLSASYTACNDLSATIPAVQNFDNLPATIRTIVGFTCYTGAGVPSDTLGVDGDIYINVG